MDGALMLEGGLIELDDGAFDWLGACETAELSALCAAA
jgi:hypothetical protein